MQGKDQEIPMQMYHRIYRFAVKNIPPRQIAATLNLPPKTVQRIIDRFAEARRAPRSVTPQKQASAQKATFLDIYLLPKTQYVVIDMAGAVIEEHAEKLRGELAKILESEWKTAAIMMKDVRKIDEVGLAAIMHFHEAFKLKGRYAAILDPSPRIEEFLVDHNIDDKVSVFGTEKSFEDKAFRLGRDASGRLKT